MRTALLALLLLAPGLARADAYLIATGEAPPPGQESAMAMHLGKGPYFAFERDKRWFVVRDVGLVRRAGVLSAMPQGASQVPSELPAQIGEAAQKVRDAKTAEERQRWNRELQRLEAELAQALQPKQDPAAAQQRAEGLKALADEALQRGLAQKVQ